MKKNLKKAVKWLENTPQYYLLPDLNRPTEFWAELLAEYTAEGEADNALFHQQLKKALGIVEDGRVWFGSGLLERAKTLFERETKLTKTREILDAMLLDADAMDKHWRDEDTVVVSTILLKRLVEATGGQREKAKA